MMAKKTRVMVMTTQRGKTVQGSGHTETNQAQKEKQSQEMVATERTRTGPPVGGARRGGPGPLVSEAC